MTTANRFRDRLEAGILVGDGAMGTMLYTGGVYINQCFEQLNLVGPDRVRAIHEAYLQSGSDFVETNTFGANGLRLSKYGLSGQVEQINARAAEIAREAAGDEGLVAGAMGPSGLDLVGRPGQAGGDPSDVFRSQARALAENGVDFLILETFPSSEELSVALDAVAQVTDLPVVAQLTVDEQQETVYGEPLAVAIRRIAPHGSVAAVGLNCSTGPSAMLNCVDVIRGITDKPLSVQPNAGLPRRVEGRAIYMCTPEYMAEYAKRFFEKGARIIGGCCGTTPDHIAEMAKAVRSLDRAESAARAAQSIRVEGGAGAAADEARGPALAEKSALGRKLAAGESVTTVEITPPRGVRLETVLEKTRLCAEHGVDAINIPDGPRASSRMSPLVTACLIQRQVGIETILHFCCRDRNLIGMQSDLLGAAAMGLRNMLVITGDPPKCGEYPQATGVFDMDAVALTAVLRNLNAGIDIGGNRFADGVCQTVGVGANPVAADLGREIDRFVAKVEAGAEYAITQPVFSPASLFRFLDATAGRSIPVIAGIWPFTSYKNAEFMANEVPGVSVPGPLLDRMRGAETKEAARREGVVIAREMIEAVRDRVAGFAVSAPFGNVGTALAVLGKMELDAD